MTDQFARTIKLGAATASFQSTIEGHFDPTHDYSAGTPKTVELTTIMQKAVDAGVDIGPQLRQAGRLPSSSLVMAYHDFLVANGRLEPWEYLLWVLEQDTISAELKIDRLLNICHNLEEIDISSLSRAILAKAKDEKIPDEVLIHSASQLVQVSGIQVLLGLTDTFGKDKIHVAMPFLLKEAKDPSYLDLYRRFFLEPEPLDRKPLCAARSEALKDKNVILIHRQNIAKAMLDQLYEFDKAFDFYWREYVEALIAFYNDHPDLSQKQLVEAICEVGEKVSHLADEHPNWGRALELLACFTECEEIFSNVWPRINDTPRDISGLIQELNVRDEQKGRISKRIYPGDIWKIIIERLVRACYRDDQALLRLATALRTSPNGPVSVMIEHIGSDNLTTLFDRGDNALDNNPRLAIENDDHRSIVALLGVRSQIHIRVTLATFSAPHPEPVPVATQADINIFQDLSSNKFTFDVAFRLIEDIHTLDDGQKAKLLLRTLSLPDCESICQGSESLAKRVINKCGGPPKALDLIATHGNQGSWENLAYQVVQSKARLLHPFN